MSRTYFTADRVRELERRLADRDWTVLKSVGRLRLVTGEQLGRLHFTDTTLRQRRRALARLVDLRLLAVLDRRIGGVRAGSDGLVYTLDVAGIRLMEVGAQRRVQRPTTPSLLYLRHALKVSELYVQLSEVQRKRGFDLLDFEAEPACWRSFAGRGGGRGMLKPDAYVRIATEAFEDSWFVEVDLATESPRALDRKLAVYRQYWQSGREQAACGVFPRVLWLVPDERRHAVVADACARQPTEVWPLFLVTLVSDAAGLMTGAAA